MTALGNVQQRQRKSIARRLLRAAGVLLLAIVIVVAVLIGFAAVMRIQHVSLPAPSGPSAVGRAEFTMTDAARTDPFETDGRRRELVVWIWYPATATTGTKAPYLPEKWAPMVGDIPLSQDLTDVSTNAYEGAALKGRPPVVVLLPGLGQPVASYSTIAEELASHGYAVIGINETGSAATLFPDGHVVPVSSLGTIAEANIDAWYAKAERVTNVWVADALFVGKQLAANAPSIGALDFTHVAYAGHSLGGAAAFEACKQDPRCAASVDLDGTLWTEVRKSGLAAPRLLLQHAPADSCDQFCTRAAADFATVMGGSGGVRMTVAGTVHQNFSDAGLLFSPANPLVLGRIDGQRMALLMRDIVRSFLDVHVLGSPADTFTSTVAKYAELAPVK